MNSVNKIRRMISIFTLFMGGLFSLILIIVIISMVESYLSKDSVAFEDNLQLMIFYIIVAAIFSISYLFSGFKLIKGKEITKTFFITLETLFVLFAVILILLGIIFGFIVPPDFTGNILSTVMILLGAIHLGVFIILLFPKMRTNLLAK